MNLGLPQRDRYRDRFARCPGEVFAFPPGLASSPAFHDHLDRAADADEERVQPGEAARAIRQDREQPRVGVVVADIDDNVQPEASVSGDGFVHRRVEGRDHGLKVWAFPTRAKALGRDLPDENIDAEVQPRPLERLLDRRHDARLPGTRRPVQNDDSATALGIAHIDSRSESYARLGVRRSPLALVFRRLALEVGADEPGM